MDNLAATLEPGDFHRLGKEYPQHLELMRRKGVYFYDYASTYDVFSETALPPKAAFYNKLRENDITDEEYDRACEVYSKLDCKNLQEYMEHYVKSDTLILLDVFENFRKLCLEYYGLDCSHYVSIPAFAWDAMLKKTGVRLELMNDVDMYRFVEDNLRGGLCTINHRYFVANNKYLDNYNPDLVSSFIHYIDCNNLYGASMMKKLPTGNYRWIEEPEKLDLLSLDPGGDTCYIVEADFGYPFQIHDHHNGFPLAAQSMMIKEEWISPYNKEFLEKHGQKFQSTRKLCPNLFDKTKYVCSLRNLQLWVQLGLTLNKVHRVLAADQQDFLKVYIDFNSEKRQSAKSRFASDLFKLVNNAVYGKFIENIRKRTNVDIVKEERKARKLISKPQFKGFHILDEEVTIVQSLKKIVKLNKPVACGFMVLENSKYIMADMWYNVLKPKYGEKIKLILSDTDSFVYGVESEDGYKDLYDMRDYMDLSGYDENTVLGQYKDTSKRKVPGMFSDEKPDQIIMEAIALKPKMYSLKTRVLKCKNTDPEHMCEEACKFGNTIVAKAITATAKKSISHDDYRTVLESRGTTITTVKSIRSYQHQLHTISVSKRGLSCFDDKKYILDNGVETLSYGHFRLNNI